MEKNPLRQAGSCTGPSTGLCAGIMLLALLPGWAFASGTSASASASASAGAGAAKAVRSEASLVSRGRYLVRIAGCNDCHTPGYLQAAGKMDEKHWLTGDGFGWRGPWGTSYATNLRLYVAGMSEAQWLQRVAGMRSRPRVIAGGPPCAPSHRRAQRSRCRRRSRHRWARRRARPPAPSAP